MNPKASTIIAAACYVTAGALFKIAYDDWARPNIERKKKSRKRKYSNNGVVDFDQYRKTKHYHL